MTPAWWITWAIMGLYVLNAAWLLMLGKPWAAGYWLCALGITICAMQSLAK